MNRTSFGKESRPIENSRLLEAGEGPGFAFAKLFWSIGEHQEKVKIKIQLFFGKTPPFRSKPVLKNFNKLFSAITFSDIRILALQVKNPVHNVRLWHTGMTRSLEFSRIRAPWSHNQGIRTDKVGNLQ